MQFPHTLIRNLHLAASPFLGAFVYSGALREYENFVAIVQFGVFPLLAGAGLALWLAPRLARRARRRGERT